VGGVLENDQSKPRVVLDSLDQRRLCVAALDRAGDPTAAAALLGVSRDDLLDLLVRLRVDWIPIDSSDQPAA
jgi:hypothetical protein